jgi:hypothetical protein
MIFLSEANAFLQISCIGLFVANRAYLCLKHLSGRKYSFLKVTQFSQGISVPHAPASKTDGFLQEIQVFFQLS